MTKNDFYALYAYFQTEGAVLPEDKCVEDLYREFVERRENSDFIMQCDSEDARFDAEMDLAEEIMLRGEREYSEERSL